MQLQLNITLARITEINSHNNSLGSLLTEILQTDGNTDGQDRALTLHLMLHYSISQTNVTYTCKNISQNACHVKEHFKLQPCMLMRSVICDTIFICYAVFYDSYKAVLMDLRGRKWQEAAEHCIMRSFITCTLRQILLG
jgi:hypothetical protein